MSGLTKICLPSQKRAVIRRVEVHNGMTLDYICSHESGCSILLVQTQDLLWTLAPLEKPLAAIQELPVIHKVTRIPQLRTGLLTCMIINRILLHRLQSTCTQCRNIVICRTQQTLNVSNKSRLSQQCET